MAAAAPAHVSAPLSNQKQRRAAQRKERRKRKRQALAQARECGASPRPDEEEEEVNDDDNEVDRRRLHEEWLEKERLAQEEFRLKAEREEAAQLKKEEEERMIKEEWEAQQKTEQEEREQKQKERRGREEAVQKMLDEAESQLENGGPWMNPEAPATQNSENLGTERDVANCPFFLKTGACRFGDRCSRKHVYPASSPTLMIRGMFTTFGMEEACRDDYDIDAWVEHTEEDLQEAFLDFYHDVLPEMKSVGKVLQFKVSCNYEPHLRGNVYVQFDTEEQCKDAFIKFNGRWYAGRQLHCEICPVTRWKNAICGLFDRQKCPKGKHCNFLHVFRNPSSEFWEADRDLHMSPGRSAWGSRRDGWRSERSDRTWRQRRGSRSPPRSERSQSRRDGDRRRSRSRERRDRWSSRSRYSDRRSERHSRRSRDRSRSRSRSREKDRRRDRSKDRSGSRERERESTDSHRKARERSRSSSREERKKSPKKQGPEGADKKKKKSKKSKKKSKKKHRKKKSRSSEGTTSSGESEPEEAKEESRADVNPEGESGQKMNGTEPVQKDDNEVEESECVAEEKTDAAEVKGEEMESEPAGQPEPSVSLVV